MYGVLSRGSNMRSRKPQNTEKSLDSAVVGRRIGCSDYAGPSSIDVTGMELAYKVCGAEPSLKPNWPSKDELKLPLAAKLCDRGGSQRPHCLPAACPTSAPKASYRGAVDWCQPKKPHNPDLKRSNTTFHMFYMEK